jgi:hypothetical protein
MSAARAANPPRPCRVHVAADGAPLVVDGDRVAGRREWWLVEDGWWTPRPVRRAYWELVTASGHAVVVFCDLVAGGWYVQAGA